MSARQISRIRVGDRRRVFRVLLGAFASALLMPVSLFPSAALAQQGAALSTTAAERINSAAMQRMLSQRIAKAYAQLLLSVQTKQAEEVLAASVQKFNSNMAVLRGAGLAGEAARALAELERASTPLLVASVGAPTPSTLPAIAKASDDTLAAAEALVRVMPASTAPGASMIALAGRQRMLSQRAAKTFFMYQAGIKTPEMRTAFEKAIRDFDLVLEEFKAQSAEYPEVRDEVELAGVQMDFFKTAAKSLDGATDAQKSTVARSSERVLETMDSMTKDMIAKFALRDPASPGAGAAKKR